MANDRLYLVCPGCGETRLLYKYYPSGGYGFADEGQGAWLDEHVHTYAMFIPVDHAPMIWTEEKLDARKDELEALRRTWPDRQDEDGWASRGPT